MTPPPGWYRDPAHPHLERWWDGTAWTEHRREPAPAGPPPVPPVPGRPPGGEAPGRAKAVALITAGVVLVASIVTGALVLREDDGAEDDTTVTESITPTFAPTSGTPAPTPSDATTEPSADDPAVVEDQLNGITVPLLDGWVRPQYIVDDDVLMSTDGTYDCPGDPGVCRHGLVISRTVTSNDETSPEALAKADISDAADDAYDRDLVGKRPFGGIESHELVKSGPVAVAGRAGYYVRWRVKTAEGPGGYVQSLAFQSSVGTESPVVVRYVFDAGEDGPPLADMDRITKGIRSGGDANGGGVGSSIGPTD
ncbi:DUF2510 domain-containing protein [Streptomyces sp. S3(2020)]|uniref:DUF2510 domain-containing protein n=1 Tax=Streptomyces sp. S3(2020) TaxID=2732044 RepID=UPI0014897605|nr:DUF2510 domain-containing protein [Streptomyces sp. S3(2020)]NNN37523.1 DUF2510 domain-containing protein [Streptomyces sp. S3(2020)]